MGALVKELLGRLCVEFGWSYAVVWRAIRCGSQIRNLVWEDGHCGRVAASGFEAIDMLIKESGVLRSSSQNGGFGCQSEDKVRALVFKLMATQVHVVGDGIVGKAASTGNHEWVRVDALADNGSTSRGLSEINSQYLAGIKTVVIIPVLPYGILQLGSLQMVLENFGFINYVKGLFQQLQFVPRSLLSDNTQKNLHQQVQLYDSAGMQAGLNQYGEVGTNMNILSSLNDDKNNCRHFSDAYSRSCTVSCPSSKQLCDQRSASVSQFPSVRENFASTLMPLSTQPIVCSAINSILHLNNPLEGGPEEAHLMSSNQDARFLTNALLCKSRFQDQIQSSTGLPYHRLTFLEEQLLSVSGARPGEYANNCESTLGNTNMHQFQTYECSSLNPLQGSEIFSSVARNQLLDQENDFSRLNSFRITEGFKSQCSDLSEPRHLNFTGNSAEKQKSNSDQFHGLASQSIKIDVHGSAYCSLLDNPTDGSIQKNIKHQDSACVVENGRGLISSMNDTKVPPSLEKKVLLSCPETSSGNDLFDVLRLEECKSRFSHGNLDDLKMHRTVDVHELSTSVTTCVTELEDCLFYNSLSDDICCGEMFSETGSDQLLDAVVTQFNPGAKYEMEDDTVSCKTSLTGIISSSHHIGSPTNKQAVSPEQMEAENFGLPPVDIKAEPLPSGSVKPLGGMERHEECDLQSNGSFKSQINLWIGGQKMNHDSSKRVNQVGKQNKKRSRPGENPRPRPKDRQMIQDRLNELRVMIPNGAKLSIDALLEKTIKHMLFLQSVTKHADKLKETGESKILDKEGGLLLKDNFDGGATWAFEIGNQSMICPIIVEDLNPPRQMLVEMLCEERGLFLEIADLVRGLGLTILKGVMEARNDKIWARFAVEANRDVTRMEIFLSLVQLLEPSAAGHKSPEGVDNANNPRNTFHSPSSIPATGLSDRLW